MSSPAVAETSEKSATRTLEWLALATAVAAGMALISWVLWRCGSGYDFSDEGFYLGWISNPSIYKVSVTEFGYIYHPLYRLVGGDIALLRRANILITLGLAWLVCFVFFRKVALEDKPVGPWRRLPFAGVAAILSTNTLVILRLWMPTPNYNSLTLQALLVAGLGFLLAEPRTSRGSVTGWVLLGFSGWLAAMAKPTSAMALGAVLGFCLPLSGKFRVRLILIAVGTALLLVILSAWIIDGSVAAFIWRLMNGAADANMLQNYHTLSAAFRWDDFFLSTNEKGALAIATLLLFLATYFCLSARPTVRLSGAASALIFSLICISIVTGLVFLDWSPARARYLGLQYWAVPFSALLAMLVVSYRNFSRLISVDRLALVLCFAAFPHVYAFGTDDNYWASAGWASFFWVLAGVVVLGSIHTRPMCWRVFLPVAAGTQVFTAAILSLYMEQPYRQIEPLRMSKDTMQIALTGSTLRVSRQFANYVRGLAQLAKAGGFKPGEPVLDMTGHYPGALYAIGARLTGRPWMIGGYPGSDALAIASLDRVPREELRRAWILMEPNGPRKLSPEILKRYGIDLTKDYLEVGAIDSPTGTYPDSYKQRLLRPVLHDYHAN